MIDERLYVIGPELQQKLAAESKNNRYTKAFEIVQGHYNIGRKPFYDFEYHCKLGYENGPYNPDNQAKFRAVYDRDDTLTKEEYGELRKIDQVKYVFYHLWKKGEVTEEQLKQLNWFEFRFPKIF